MIGQRQNVLQTDFYSVHIPTLLSLETYSRYQAVATLTIISFQFFCEFWIVFQLAHVPDKSYTVKPRGSRARAARTDSDGVNGLSLLGNNDKHLLGKNQCWSLHILING